MDERRRLVERVFSREGAQEEARDRRDPVTGRILRMTPSEWALAEYDRAHADAQAGAGETREGAAAEETDGVDPDEKAAPSAGPRARASRHRLALAGAVVGAFALGVVVSLGVTAAGTLFGVDSPGTSPVGVASSVSTDDPDGGSQLPSGAPSADWHPLVEPEVQEYFASTPRVDDLPAAVTDGFDPTSFRLVAGSVMMQQSASIYAAKRLDDQYCLVAVASDARVVETCATAAGISQHGLSLTKDAVRDLDGRPLTVTVTWGEDGAVSWEWMPSAG